MTLLTALPLRSTAEWGDYREPVSVPVRFGETGGRLLQYGPGRQRFVWAGHAVLAVDAVRVSGVEAGNWTWRNGVDTSGLPVAFVEFDQPVDEGVELTARGRGKLSPLTGGLMESPAEVILDLLTLAGSPITAAQLAEFARECAADDITVAGSVETADPARSVILSVCASIGALFAPDSANVCTLAKSSPVGSPVATVKPANIARLTARLDGIVNDLTLRYAWDAGEPRAAVRLIADESVRRYGVRPVVMDALWLPMSSRLAAAVGSRYLSAAARPAWGVSAFGLRRRVRVGDVAAVEPPYLPPSTAQALGVERDLQAGLSSLSLSLPAGAAPTVRIAQLSERVDVEPYAGLAVDTIGDSRVMTVLRASGSPDAGAVVTISGASMVADGAGRVSIPVYLMPRGQHLVSIRYTSGETMQTVVTV